MSDINVVDHSSVSILIINAMSEYHKKISGVDIRKTFNVPDNTSVVDVRLTINGVEVDALLTLHTVWERLHSSHEREVLEEAKALVMGSPLKVVMDKLNDFQWQMEDVLAALQAQLKNSKTPE